MTQIDTLKAQAKNLKQTMEKMGMVMSLAQALEAIAGQYGMENWDTLAGVVNARAEPAPQVRMSDQLRDLYQVELKGCSGLTRFGLVDYINREALEYAPDELRLRQYVSENPEKYPGGMGHIGLRVEDGSRVHKVQQFSLAELAGVKFHEGYWHLPSGLMAMRFHSNGAPVESATKVDLAIPQMVKSAKGCQLIILASGDGAQYDRHVIVPPHLDAEAISRKIRDEIRRLKQIDAEHAEDENYDEYTAEDLARYVGSIGCLWVSDRNVCGENWD